MPYIKQDRRTAIDGGSPPEDVGELNYLMTMTVLRHVGRQQAVFDKLLTIGRAWVAMKGLKYQQANDVIGALNCAAYEMRRRTRTHGVDAVLLREVGERFYNTIIAPYEDVKISENGDLLYDG